MVVVIDPQVSGLSGNMFIGAFVDLGADKEKVKEVILNYVTEFGDITVDIEKKSKSGVMTTYANIQTQDNSVRHFIDIITKLDEITRKKYSENETVINSIELSKKIFKTLADAESEVHGKSLEELHFHEVGCADAVADIVGASYAYHLLKFDDEKVYSLPVATGNGSVNTQHGILPVPAPAVINILKNVPTLGGNVNTELATPTGCAILVNITDEYTTSSPLLQNKSIGYGSGTKELKILNALRIIKSEDISEENKISILETNIDTLSGEILGNLYDTLLNEGARDVCITPTIMKKNRPGHIVKVIAKKEDSDHLVKILMEETGTLGVRILPHVHRGVAIRENVIHNVKINDNIEQIRFKIGELDGKIIKCSAEYDDLKKLSEKTKIPIKDLKEYVEQDYKINIRRISND
ncbi:MAG: nickel pincer cofactor biosynthesis protein LarC [Methanosphaera stadtmanae]|nr:nickel pincer cofactor biosynthesis protein LarC [Methanosphaera stadtmanae]